MSDDVHVYPVNDLRPHDTATRYCDCNPVIEFKNGCAVVIHNSWDGREILERAEDHAETARN